MKTLAECKANHPAFRKRTPETVWITFVDYLHVDISVLYHFCPIGAGVRDEDGEWWLQLQSVPGVLEGFTPVPA